MTLALRIKRFVEAIKPDFVYTLSGYRWLDALTHPFWEWRMRRQERELYRIIGDGDEEKGERVMKQVFMRDAKEYSAHIHDDPRIWQYWR